MGQSPAPARRPEPFFATPPCETPRGRLLLLTHHFPPGQAAGARRWEKLAHHVVARGYGLDVVTLAPESLASRDDRRLESLPPGVRVFGVARREHPVERIVHGVWYALRKLRPARRAPIDAPRHAGASAPTTGGESASEWLRREEVVGRGYGPSVWMSTLRVAVELAGESAWADDAVALGRSLLDRAEHRAIVSCGPPHMIHRSARQLSRRTGLPLVCDLRDPWSRNERVIWSLGSPLWYDLAARFEARAFRQASLVVMNTPAARQLMAEVHPELADRIIAVPNGFDELERSPERAPARPSDAFVIAYAGSIYLDRSPRLLFRAVARVSQSLGLGADRLRIELMGHYDAPALEAMAREEGVAEQVVLRPPGTVRDVAELLERSSLLVNLPQDSDLAIPSKIYEYMVHPAWLLALAVPRSATAQILEGTDAHVVAPDDVDRIAEVIRSCWEAHARGVRPEPVARDPRLGRAHQAARLIDAVERCLAEDPHTRAAPRLEAHSMARG